VSEDRSVGALLAGLAQVHVREYTQRRVTTS
jgi:hypothetical protein